jgi:methyl halide transferase
MSVDWSERYQSGETPWEKGEPHPELPFLLSKHHGVLGDAERILVPGCGFGHDAALLHSVAQTEVLGLDLAKEPIENARERYYRRGLAWTVGDLFKWLGRYDLVFEHTCFCAIPLERRGDYVAAMARIIPEGGHLLGIFFLNPDHEREEGPPFGVTLDELTTYFGEDFELVWSQEPARTYAGREGEGRELSMLWKRRPSVRIG